MSWLLSLVGTPSPKLHATLNILRALVQVTFGEHVVIVVNSIEALREQFPDKATRNEKPVIVMSDYPKPELLAAFYNLNAPVAICIDDFTTIALFSVVSRGFGGVEAARFATMGLVNVEPTTVSPPATSLFVGDPKVETLDGLIGKLAALYQLPMTGNSLDGVLKFAGFAGQGDTALSVYIDRTVASAATINRDGRATLEKRSPLENELIDFLAAQYDCVAHGQGLERLEWPVFSLLQPSFPDQMTIGPIDLTGPARYIYFGPYFALPIGAWNVDITLEVQDCLSDNEIAIDVFATEPLSIVRTKLPARGVYGCQIRFEIEDSSKPVEIRMQLLTGAIEGLLQLRQIKLRRLESLDAPDEAAL